MPKRADVLEELKKIFSVSVQSEGSELLEMPHWDFGGALSPLPGDRRTFGTVDFQVEKMRLSQEEKKRLIHAFVTTGFVGKTRHGWLFISNGAKGQPELAVANSRQVDELPHLPDGWEDLMVHA
jgi:hypothetical protein